MNQDLRRALLFLRLSRPPLLLAGVLLYGLGTSIALFLGKPFRPGLFLFGQGMVTSIQLVGIYLCEAYEDEEQNDDQEQPSHTDPDDAAASDRLPRQTSLYAAIVCLTLAATLASAFLVSGVVPVLAWLLIALGLLGAIAYSLPPLQLKTSGYGELVLAILLGSLVPVLAFALQTGRLHRLLLMSTTPLVALYFAMMIALEFRHYAHDVKHGIPTLTVRLGWATAMRVHNLAILFAVFSFGAAYFNGLPPRVTFGALIALPLAGAQIWQMDRIRRGYTPRWSLLSYGAMGLFALTAYLELIGYLLS